MTPKVDTRTLMRIAAACKRLRISRQALYEALGKSRLKTVDIGGVPFVTKKSVEEYLKTRHPGGPKKRKRKT
jgi:hypothetical protein